jgi:hypothetical protein
MIDPRRILRLHQMEGHMNNKMRFKGMRPAAGLIAIILAGMLGSPSARAQGSVDTPRILQGFAIAPVPLNMGTLDPNLVGLGSYLVNAIGDCNGCHTSGGPPNFNYAAGGNPYFGQRTQVDPTVYLSGGMDFGPVGPPNNPGPDIIARNLTPDKTGLPEGGHTLSEFMQIMRSGIDFDHLHPTCTSTSPTPTPANCIPPPVRGDLLQVMPWPTFSNLSDSDLLAIYTYLSAIPCLAGSTDPTNVLYNNCGTPPAGGGGSGVTIVVTGPGGATSATNTFSTVSNQITLSASLSTSSNPGALTYSWTPSPGYPNVSIQGATTAAPTFQLLFHAAYQFALTVTDQTGAKATATITVQFI